MGLAVSQEKLLYQQLYSKIRRLTDSKRIYPKFSLSRSI